MGDLLGNRMKENYENRTRYLLPRRTNIIIRLDGKAFHTFTRNCKRPFDNAFIAMMNHTAKDLCASIQGVKCAFVQSDEISLLLTDYDDIKTDAWFDGNIQKIVSVSASMATLFFNQRLHGYNLSREESDNCMKGIALFDSRVFTIPDNEEVVNYFIWRQQDATRNSVQMVAQYLYSHKELHGQNSSQLQELIFQKGINWNDYPTRCKRGGLIVKENYDKEGVQRSMWVLTDTPIFSKDREALKRFLT
jgi:tRNA(His) guanylyltransferase